MNGLTTEQMRVIRAKFKPTGAQVHEARKQFPLMSTKEAYRYCLKANMGKAIYELDTAKSSQYTLEDIKLILHGLVFFAYYGNETGD